MTRPRVDILRSAAKVLRRELAAEQNRAETFLRGRLDFPEHRATFELYARQAARRAKRLHQVATWLQGGAPQ